MGELNAVANTTHNTHTHTYTYTHVHTHTNTHTHTHTHSTHTQKVLDTSCTLIHDVGDVQYTARNDAATEHAQQ